MEGRRTRQSPSRPTQFAMTAVYVLYRIIANIARFAPGLVFLAILFDNNVDNATIQRESA